MQDTIDLEDLVLGKNIDEVKQLLKDNHGDEIGDEICRFLEVKDLFDWIKVINNAERDVLDSDSFIGTKDLELEGILNFRKILKILSDSDNVSWRDPSRFSVYIYSGLAEAIDSKFDSDREYIEYMEDKNTDEENEKLYELHNSLHSEDEDELMSIIGMFGSKDEYDLKFSKLYSATSRMYDLTIPDESEWDSDPNIGDYVTFSATKDDGSGGKVLLKIKDIKEEELRYSDISDEPVDDDFVLDTRKSLVVENIAHEDDVFEAYENHFLIQDTMETNKLEPRYNDSVTFYKENPLPF